MEGEMVRHNRFRRPQRGIGAEGVEVSCICLKGVHGTAMLRHCDGQRSEMRARIHRDLAAPRGALDQRQDMFAQVP
jgi:hypothetical protein